MPEDTPAPPAAPPAPAQDLGRTPTLLETLAGSMDLSDAPTATAKTLPPILEDAEQVRKEEPKKPEKKEEPKPEDIQAELQKAGDVVANKLFKKRAQTAPPKEEEKKVDTTGPTSSDTDATPPDKPKKPAKTKTAAAPAIDHAAIAAAAATAATQAAMAAAKPATYQPAIKEPDQNLSAAERKEFDVYRELELSNPDRYKGVTTRYLKSLEEIAGYIKQWGKDNPGTKFNAQDEQHDSFFQSVEPEVDDDDWVDAKAAIKAREIAAKAVAPVNERLKEMQQQQARSALEPVVAEKQLEAVHHLLNHFDPQIAEEIRKENGLTELSKRDPITVKILNKKSARLGSLAATVVRLHDPMAGIKYDANNAEHKEVAEFILDQERRISQLPPEDRLRDGKMFMPRFQYYELPTEQKANFWMLSPDDVIYLLGQKFAIEAKKMRDEELGEFNQTAERLGYKRSDAPKSGSNNGSTKPVPAAAANANARSPEAVSKASVRTTVGAPVKAPDDVASAIVGKLFAHVRS